MPRKKQKVTDDANSETRTKILSQFNQVYALTRMRRQWIVDVVFVKILKKLYGSDPTYSTELTPEQLNLAITTVKKTQLEDSHNTYGLFRGLTKTNDLSLPDKRRRNIVFYYCCNPGTAPEIDFGTW